MPHGVLLSDRTGRELADAHDLVADGAFQERVCQPLARAGGAGERRIGRTASRIQQAPRSARRSHSLEWSMPYQPVARVVLGLPCESARREPFMLAAGLLDELDPAELQSSLETLVDRSQDEPASGGQG